jgi:hypothetical protein
MRSALALFLGTTAALAQDAPVAALPEIRGIVVEGDTNVPVADAKVTISILEGYSLKEITKASTDTRGVFQLRLEKLDE